MTIEEMAKEYADEAVKKSSNNVFTKCQFHRQKELTTFSGYDMEQAYEDGAYAVLNIIEETIKAQLGSHPNEEAHVWAVGKVRLKIKELKGE